MLRYLLIALVACSWSLTAMAQGDDPLGDILGEDTPAPQDKPAPEPKKSSPPSTPGIPKTSQPAAAPGVSTQAGEASALMYPIEQGFFIEAEPGVFLTIGGAEGVSEVQPYMAFDIGYDVADNFAIGLNLAWGASAGNPRISRADVQALAPYTYDTLGLDVDPMAEDFTMALADVFFEYRISIAERWAIPFSIVGGLTFINPTNPNTEAHFNPDAEDVVSQTDKEETIKKGEEAARIRQEDPLGADSEGLLFNAGAQTGIHYYSRMRHFNLGFEVGAYYIIGPNIPALAIYPTIRYTF